MKRRGLSARKAAEMADLSEARWRHIVSGAQPVTSGVWAPVRGPAETVARMARVVGLTHEAFEGIRDDVMQAMLDEEEAQAEKLDATYIAAASDNYARLRHQLGLLSPRQIELLTAVAEEFTREGYGDLNPPEEEGSPGDAATAS